ncbi:pyridoxal 5'-phosphate synthase [Kitasatospora sp. NPDC096147]|uniref:pyridoxine/pyridoxamine 5'-phosphate oxidase n=1 Tax=Kitasatospora sp. NPDC096147 TaxID=3364093 RepID=UPI00381DE32A
MDEGVARERDGRLAELREVLRSRPPMARELPGFDVTEVPAEPAELHVAWLLEALRAGVPDAQLVTLSTVDGDGRPDARIVGLRDIDPAAGTWSFVADRRSPKGHQLATAPWAAMTSYWPASGRQVRLRGPVVAVDQQDAPRAERSVSPAAHAAALVGRQSEDLGSLAEFGPLWERALALATVDPDGPVPGLTKYLLRADTVEFWQGDAGRQHVRLAYCRGSEGWRRSLLWP